MMAAGRRPAGTELAAPRRKIDSRPGIRPRPSLWRRLDASARAGFPASITALLLLILAAPLGLPAQAELQGALALAAVFFWSLYRPSSMPPQVVFLLGVLLDLLGITPLGTSVITLLIAHGMALASRRVLLRHGFLVIWLGFVLVAGVTSVLGWALVALLSFRLLTPVPMLFQCLLAVGIYPLVAVAFIRAHRGAAAPEQA